MVGNMAEKIPHTLNGSGGFCLRQTGRDPGEYNVKESNSLHDLT